MWKTVISLVAALAFTGPVLAQPVDTAIVFSVDSSGSIDDGEFALQRQGYARALLHPEVQKAIRNGPAKSIAISFVEWSGPEIFTVVLGWTRITGLQDAEAVAAKLTAAPRTIFGGGTSLGGAIRRGIDMLAALPFDATRRVIDVSGDGPNNRGDIPPPARDRAVAAGITVNGLAILDFDDGLATYFENRVIGGPGAFVIGVDGFEDFAEAVRKKLVRELRITRLDADAGSRQSPSPGSSGSR